MPKSRAYNAHNPPGYNVQSTNSNILRTILYQATTNIYGSLPLLTAGWSWIQSSRNAWLRSSNIYGEKHLWARFHSKSSTDSVINITIPIIRAWTRKTEWDIAHLKRANIILHAIYVFYEVRMFVLS